MSPLVAMAVTAAVKPSTLIAFAPASPRLSTFVAVAGGYLVWHFVAGPDMHGQVAIFFAGIALYSVALYVPPPRSLARPRWRRCCWLSPTSLSRSSCSRSLTIAESNVKSRVNRILGRLQATNRVQAAIMARNAGLTRDS